MLLQPCHPHPLLETVLAALVFVPVLCVDRPDSHLLPISVCQVNFCTDLQHAKQVSADTPVKQQVLLQQHKCCVAYLSPWSLYLRNVLSHGEKCM